jgi:DNA-directed RNA polymerase specialized sigma24 family protein
MSVQQEPEQREFQELMERVQQGDPDATRQLVAEYGVYVMRFVRRYRARALRSKFDPEDHVQEVWQSFFRKLPKLHFAHPQVLRAFLFRVTHNQMVGTILHFMRTQKSDVRREVSLDNLFLDRSMLVSAEPPPCKSVDCQDEIDWILKGACPIGLEIVRRLAEGNSQKEAAQALHVAEKTVGRSLAFLRLRSEKRR